MCKGITKRILSAVLAGMIALGSGYGVRVMAEEPAENPSYSVTLEAAEGGKLHFADSEEVQMSFQAGDNVAFYSVPEEGYRLESIMALTGQEEEIPVTAQDNICHMAMPESDVRIVPAFAVIEEPEDDDSASDPGTQSLPDNTVTENPDINQKNELSEEIPYPEAAEEESENAATLTETDSSADILTGVEWIPRTKEEVDAMVGMASARKRMLLRAGSTTIYEGAMNNFYGGATPHLYDSNGNLVYCILPWSSAPNGVAVNFSDYGISSGSDANLQLMAKLMYYGYGGGGNILGGYSASDQEAITHFALSYVWMINMGNTHGLSNWARTGNSVVDGNGQAIVMGFLNQVQGLPAVTGTLHVAAFYEASGQMYQDLAYGSFQLELQEGELDLSKTSAYPEITDGNGCYSLEGAVYGVYTDPGCTNKAGQFTTDRNGKATARLTLEAGTYYVKETSPSPGYFLDTAVYTAAVSSDTTSMLSVKEVPGNDPVGLMLLKRDSETGKPQQNLKLSGAEYTVKHYAVSSETDPAKDGIKPMKTWVFKTDENGRIVLDAEHFVSGDSFYKVNGETVLPLGTITLQETKAPEGYVIDSTLFVANTHIQSGTSTVTSNLPNEETKASREDVIRGDLKFYKLDAGTKKVMAGIPFSITNAETGESHIIVSDTEGLVSTASEDRKHTVNTNKGETGEDGIWFGTAKPDDAKGALLYGEYTVKELPCKTNYGKDLVEFEVTIRRNKQVVNYPETYNYDILLSTTAKDAATDTKTVAAEPSAKVVDTVAYENLTVGRTYTLKGTLMDRKTGEAVMIGGKKVTAEKSFTPAVAKGSVSMTFDLDASGLEGKTLVVFEELYWGPDKVADHSDIGDDAQAVFVPSVHTIAADSRTKDEVGTVSEKAAVRDLVEYTGLTPGKAYHLKGVLMDRETGEPVKVNGREITAEKDFVPETSDGSVELAVSVDSSGLSGKTAVMFETVTYKGRQVAIHADISDRDQTVFYPEIHTSAVDKDTKDSVGTVSGTAEIIDTVSCKNLVPGKEYTIKGRLMDKETGKPLTVNGKQITAEKNFKVASASGTVKLVFKLDSSVLQGKSVVVFEDLYHNRVKAAAHADIRDNGQTIDYPKIATSAKDSQTNDGQGTADNKVTVKDTVRYTNLIPGKSYTVKGTLMNQQTGKAVLADGKPVTEEKTFTTDKADGEVELEFILNSLLVKGQTVVVFEDLYHNDIKVTAHADIKDEGQSVHVPEIRTNAVDGETKNHIGTVAKKAAVADTVSYTNLIPGNEYTIKGVLMDKETGKPCLVKGSEIVAQKVFTAAEPNGEVELVYELDSADLAGRTVVVFEKLLYKGMQIYTHAEISDEKQSVHYPEIHTSAKDAVTSGALAQVSENTTITDTVTYQNLIPGETYTLVGTLMNKGTGEELTVEGIPVTAQKTFKAGKADGETELSFTFPAEKLQGTTTVVFEKLYSGEINVVSHENLNDEGQTVYIPKLRTTAVDRETKSHTGSLSEKAVIVDMVNYSNLIAGREYTVKGMLMNKETGEPVMRSGKEITAEKTFTAETADGSVMLSFEIDSNLMEGKSVVVFEDLYYENILLVCHTDINDGEQSVHYPKIGTNASVGGSKTVTADTFVTLTDVVKYENLIPGEKYSLQGILMDQATGKELIVNGNIVKASIDFTAESKDGQEEVVFSFDAENLGGHSVVVFEKLFHNGKEIAVHEDIKDEGQTVVFTTPPTITHQPPETGDPNTAALFAAVLAASGAALAVLTVYRKKRKQ